MSPTPLDSNQVTMAARAACGRPTAMVSAWTAAPATHVPDNMTTASLDVVRGCFDDTTPFTLFVKTLRPASESPIWELIPEPARANVLAELDWLDEPRVYRSGLSTDLPDGLRLPQLLGLVDRGDHIQLWLEHVDDRTAWDLDRYRRTSEALGRLSGRWPADRVDRELGFRRRTLRELWYGKTVQADLPRLADDDLWKDPAFAVDPGLRRDLGRVMANMPELIERLECCTGALAHGDACPANLLCGDDGSIVAADWSYGANSSIGSDLGQLLAGGAVDGGLETADIEQVAMTIRTGYLQGLAEEGAAVDESAVELAFTLHLLVRSAIAALGDIAAVAADRAATRVALARHGVDRALQL